MKTPKSLQHLVGKVKKVRTTIQDFTDVPGLYLLERKTFEQFRSWLVSKGYMFRDCAYLYSGPSVMYGGGGRDIDIRHRKFQDGGLDMLDVVRVG